MLSEINRVLEQPHLLNSSGFNLKSITTKNIIKKWQARSPLEQKYPQNRLIA